MIAVIDGMVADSAPKTLIKSVLMLRVCVCHDFAVLVMLLSTIYRTRAVVGLVCIDPTSSVFAQT